MAEQNFFSHTSPPGDTMVQQVHSAGIFYFMLGENLFKCITSSTVPRLCRVGWSPGHHENILRPEYLDTGIGVWRGGTLITQLFMRSLSLIKRT